ncbi:hypothetical protein H0H81_012503 [Sphagnurus paluster]|uniref:FAD-binding PCMH-type domain-containing protein n=1 Tax=Sphagnurus paluster TaxID=117069 RepID=A0A9P7FTI6_9AGAR|nr:hypothetical protein H0H81_012503 [Sphagnurus paluster]
MSRFREIAYNATSQNVIVGAGLVWDDVYAALEPHNANVVGGRESGVGVAGLTLGYSWLSNQHGLTLDTVQAFELVKPDGVVVTVTQTSDPELFFGLKGGMNNFVKPKAYFFCKVWGGLLTYTSAQVSAISAAIAAFSASSTDPKAGLTMAYNFLGELEIRVLLFYDGPTPPAGIFDKFLAIPFYSKDISTRDFLSLVKASPPFTSSALQRVLFNTVSLAQYTPAILKVIVNETIVCIISITSDDWVDACVTVLGFAALARRIIALDLLRCGAIPALFIRARGAVGLSSVTWIRESYDNDFYAAARESAAHIRACAIAEGQDIAGAAVYPGYALFGTPISDLYGANLPALQALKAKVDPDNVMGLAGGFKI